MVATGGCFLGGCADGATESDSGPGSRSPPGWIEVCFRHGREDVRLVLLAVGAVRVDVVRDVVGGQTPLAGGNRTFLLPCSGSDVNWLLSVMDVALEQGVEAKRHEHAGVRWSRGGRTHDADVPVRLVGAGLVTGLVREMQYVGYYDLSLSIVYREDAESLAKAGRLAKACDAYEKALRQFFKWGAWRASRTRPGLLYEPEVKMASAVYSKNNGFYSKALNEYRELWNREIPGEIGMQPQEGVTEISFHPDGVLSHGLPSHLDPREVQLLLDHACVSRR